MFFDLESAHHVYFKSIASNQNLSTEEEESFCVVKLFVDKNNLNNLCSAKFMMNLNVYS